MILLMSDVSYNAAINSVLVRKGCCSSSFRLNLMPKTSCTYDFSVRLMILATSVPTTACRMSSW